MKIVLTVVVCVLFAGLAQAQWLVEDLYPASGTGVSQAIGVFANEQCGFVDSNASIWHGTAASWTSPSSGFMTATDGTQQVGWSMQIGGGVFAARWVNGTLSFLTNLSGAQGSGLYALFGKIYGGYNVINGKWEAVYWTRPNRPVSLHPPGYDSSLVEAVSKSMQAGRICPVSECFAATWRGRASTVTNLHPSGFVDSNIRGMQGNTAVGWATNSFGQMHAIFWNLSNGTYTDAHPAGEASGLNAVSNNWGAGAMWPVSTSGPHAFVWDLLNSNNNADLHSFLPAGLYSDSAAFGIWRNTAGSTYVVGMATSTSDLQQHAMLWYIP
jgi:hypothetical protein